MSWTVAAGGLLVGVLVGLGGVGGGSLVTPVLILFGAPPSLAVGTDLLYASGTKLLGALQHWRLRSIDLRWVVRLATGGVPGALAGSLLAGAALARVAGGETALRHLLGLALIGAALGTGVHEYLARARTAATDAQSAGPSPAPAWLAAFGGVIGLLVGLTSIGSGSLLAPAMLASGLAPRRVVGTDIASALLISMAASAVHMAMGSVDVHLALNLMIGSLPGVLIGSRLTARVGGRPLKFLMSSLVLLSGVQLVA